MPRLARLLLPLVLITAFPVNLTAAPAATTATAAPLVRGQDYEVIGQGMSWQPVRKGEIEVVEVFAYGCPHCAKFDPMLRAWKSRQPASVRVVQLPAAFDPADPAVEAAFAVQRLGIAERATPAIFRAIHADGTLPHRPSREEFAQFLSQQGTSMATALAQMRSPQVADAARRANTFVQANQVDGTPALIVNGRYRVLGTSHEQQLVILDRMIARLRKGPL